jgi:hypothetical protein
VGGEGAGSGGIRPSSAFLDVFNVLNTINYTDIVGVTSSRFGLPSLADKGRQLQLGFTYSF